MRFDLILLNMSRAAEWEAGVINRNYYIVRELLASPHVDKVLLVDLLPHTRRRALRVWWQDVRVGGEKQTIAARALWRLSRSTNERHFFLSTVEPVLSETRFLQTLDTIMQQLHFQNPMLWSYLPTYVQAFQHPHWQMRIFDAVDDWTAHPSYAPMRERLAHNYQVITAHADRIFTVSQTLKDKFARNPNVHWIPNGVDLERFTRGTDDPYPKNGRPRIIYIGVLQRRVNIELIAEIAKQRPTYDLYLLGPVWPDAGIEPLRAIPNIKLLGFVPAERTPAYLLHANVGIMPHRPSGLMASMNPMKIFEYLAAGLPVVATPVKGFSAYTEAVTTAATGPEFCAAIDAALAHPPVRDHVRHLVESDTWSARFASMWGIIAKPAGSKASR